MRQPVSHMRKLMDTTIQRLQDEIRGSALAKGGNDTELPFVTAWYFLALSVTFAVHDVITAILGMDNDLTEKITDDNMDEHDISLSDSAVIQSVYILFSSRKTSVLSEFLRKIIMQEIFWHNRLILGM